jgi:diketogulonate reductase-like aldo/keto reductase
MPSIGLGTAGLGEATGEVVEQALSLGYRRIDSAQAREWYREDLVGQATRKSNIPRGEKLFITTKVHPRDFGRNATRAAVRRSLVDLGVPHLDLVLLHYPEWWGDLCGGVTPQGTWQDAWAELEDLISEGKVRCAGVSNFSIDQLVQLVRISKVPPCLVQSNSEPLRPNAALQAFCRAHNIHFEGYSTLGGQYWNAADGKNPVLTNPIVLDVAKAKGRSSAEVVLRWAVQSQMTVVPRSTRRDHLLQNLVGAFEFKLTDDEMEALDALGDARDG